MGFPRRSEPYSPRSCSSHAAPRGRHRPREREGVGEIADTPGVHGIAFVADLAVVHQQRGRFHVTAFDLKRSRRWARSRPTAGPTSSTSSRSAARLHIQPRHQRHHGDRSRGAEGRRSLSPGAFPSWRFRPEGPHLREPGRQERDRRVRRPIMKILEAVLTGSR